MTAKPLTPEGGHAEYVGFKGPRGTGARLDSTARRLGYRNRSDYVRSVILADLEEKEAQEVTASAS